MISPSFGFHWEEGEKEGAGRTQKGGERVDSVASLTQPRGGRQAFLPPDRDKMCLPYIAPLIALRKKEGAGAGGRGKR